MKPVVIVAGRRAEHNPDKNRVTMEVFSPEQNGGKEDPGAIILINGDVPRIIVIAPEAVLIIESNSNNATLDIVKSPKIPTKMIGSCCITFAVLDKTGCRDWGGRKRKGGG
ncbi:MAG: hypothetical protein HXY45_15575 [Syntrophaceae bacterium]|nr:hypothetical protein [Syntrophaceae bacterium]